MMPKSEGGAAMTPKSEGGAAMMPKSESGAAMMPKSEGAAMPESVGSAAARGSADGAAMLEVEGLTVRHGTLAALDGVSFSVRAGRWLMVVGPNGAGKSTLVNAISQGVPYRGAVRLDGQDVARMKPAARARRISLLAQSHYVGYSYTVEQIVRLGRYAHSHGLAMRGRHGASPSGVPATGSPAATSSPAADGSYTVYPATGSPSANDDVAIAEALAFTGMSELRSHAAPTLSGGELQRAFLAQALAQDPALLLLDEPTSHLDIIYQKQILGLIDGWRRVGRRAVVSVLHDISLARMYGTDALLLNKGRVESYGLVGQALGDENLDRVYGIDVRGWMASLLSQWAR